MLSIFQSFVDKYAARQRGKKSAFRDNHRRKLFLETLEPRIVLSGDPLMMLPDDAFAATSVAPHVLFAPGTPQSVVDAHERHEEESQPSVGAFTFNDGASWNSTATNGGSIGGQGNSLTLTWSIVPDGTPIPGASNVPDVDAPSNFIQFMDNLYNDTSGGSDLTTRNWFPIVSSAFERWDELSGINFVYDTFDGDALAGDDGDPFPSSSGSLNSRGDIRISGHKIDGNSGVLAYNYFPNSGGDMVIDTDDNFWDNTANNSLKLRNTLAHEIGHGIGIRHVDPVDQTKLLEPFASINFDGPQFDDILAVQRGYGDAHEKFGGNDTAATATSLGLLEAGTPIFVGADATNTFVNPGNPLLSGDGEFDFVSIDSDTDTDFFSFTVSGPTTVSVNLTPLGPTYESGPQGGATPDFNSKAQSNLSFQIIASNGSTVLTTAGANGIEEGESVTDFALDSGGTYYVRISGANNAAQFYQLQVSAGASIAPAAIAGTVWNDANGDGVFDTNEAGLGGVRVYLDQNTNGVFDNGETSTFSSSSGAYYFDGLDEGTYTVAQVVPTDFEQTFPAPAGSQLQLVSTWNGSTGSVVAGSSSTGEDNPQAHEDGGHDDGGHDKGNGGANQFADIWTSGNYAYLGHFATDGKVDIVDLSDPASPNWVATWQATDAQGNPQSARIQDVKVVGDIAYFASDNGGGMWIVNVSDPTSPQTLSNISSGHSNIHNLSIDGGFAYQADGRSSVVKVIDVRIPEQPSVLHTINAAGGGSVHDVTVQNGRLYLSVLSGRTDIFNVTDVANSAPVLLGSFNSGGSSHSNWPTADGNYLVSARETSNGDIRIYDISDPSNVTLEATINAASLGISAFTPHNPIVDGNILYVSWYQAGVQMFDISDPTDPIHLGGYDTFPGSPSGYNGNWGVHTWPDRPGYIVASDMQSGLFVLSTAGNGHTVTLEEDDIVAGVNFGNRDITINPTSEQFDFGTGSSPLAAGYTRVTKSTTYNASQGYGWQSGTILEFDRAIGTNITRDFNYTREGTFVVDVSNGTYDVKITVGDTGSFAHDQMGIFLEGSQVDSVSAAAGQVVTRTYQVTVSDGQLTLRLDDLGGSDPNVVIEELVVTSVGSPPADTAGPRITAADPTGTVNGSVDRITLTFDEAIADGTFTTVDVISLSGPSGSITPTAVNKLSNTQYEVVFASQSTGGNYSLTVGPQITDLAGNLMNQDNDGTNGEATDDRFTTGFTIQSPPADTTGPRITAASPTGNVTGSVDRITLTFNEAIADGTFASDDVVNLSGPNGSITPTGVNKLSSTQYQVVFASQSAAGNYSLTVGPEITDLAGNLMNQDNDGINGEVPDDRFTTSFTIASTPAVSKQFDFGTGSSPLESGYTRVTKNTTYNASQGFGWQSGTIFDFDRGNGTNITRDFNYTNLGTFAVNVPNGTYDVKITVGDTGNFPHDQMGIILEGSQVDSISAVAGQVITRTYQVTVSDGQLTLRLDDLGGSDPNVVIEELVITSVGAPPTDTNGPRITAASPTGTVNGSVDRITLTFDDAIADGTFTTADVVNLSGPSGSITPTAVNKLSNTQYEVVFASQNAAGNYSLTVGPQITDLAGNLMNQDNDGINGEVPDDRFTTSFTIASTPAVSKQFDFGTSSSPLAAGYTRVTRSTTFNASQGFGWQSGTIFDFDRGNGTNITRDFNYTNLGTFAVNVPNGTYDVKITVGDTGNFPHDQMGIILEGSQVDSISAVAGQVITRTYQVTVSDGQLTLRLDDLGGSDPNVVIEELVITSATTTVMALNSDVADNAVSRLVVGLDEVEEGLSLISRQQSPVEFYAPSQNHGITRRELSRHETVDKFFSTLGKRPNYLDDLVTELDSVTLQLVADRLNATKLAR